MYFADYPYALRFSFINAYLMTINPHYGSSYMHYNPYVVELHNKLLDSKHSLRGGTRFTLGDVEIDIRGRDGVGGLLEEWLGHWAIKNGFDLRRGDVSQEFPDYYTPDGSLLEVKSFDATATANFDIANFDAYCASVAVMPERLDADYLIFAYKLTTDGVLKIEDIYLRKIWEMSCGSKRWPLKTQTKRNVIYNIRPSTFSGRGHYPNFQTKEEFISALFETEERYHCKPSKNKELFYRNLHNQD